MKKKNGFTLAEVLITLVIVGVVAALTLPTLIAKVNEKVSENQTAVFNAKFIKGLNLAKTSGDLNNTYSSTYDFLVNGLSKHYKMSKICDSSHIRDCVPYDEIKYEKSGQEKIQKVSELNSSGKLNLNAGIFHDVAAFVSGDGTPAILSYKKECIVDTEELDTGISSCVAGIFDINGSRKPNKFGSKAVEGKTVYTGDLRSFNGASIGDCVGIWGNYCIVGAAIKASEMVDAILAINPSYVAPKTSANQEFHGFIVEHNTYCQTVYPGSLTVGWSVAEVISKNFNPSDADFTSFGIFDNPTSITLLTYHYGRQYVLGHQYKPGYYYWRDNSSYAPNHYVMCYKNN